MVPHGALLRDDKRKTVEQKALVVVPVDSNNASGWECFPLPDLHSHRGVKVSLQLYCCKPDATVVAVGKPALGIMLPPLPPPPLLGYIKEAFGARYKEATPMTRVHLDDYCRSYAGRGIVLVRAISSCTSLMANRMSPSMV